MNGQNLYASKRPKFGGCFDPPSKDSILWGLARQIAEQCAKHSVVDNIQWLSKQENRDQFIAALQYLKVHLPKLTEQLDHNAPEIPFIGIVKEGGEFTVELPPNAPVTIKAELKWVGKPHRYLIDEHGLDQIINVIKTTEWPKWNWRKRSIKTAAAGKKAAR